MTPDELLAVGLAESPIFEPGAKFDYSNTNTILLGMVIEKVTGQPVEDVLPGADPRAARADRTRRGPASRPRSRRRTRRASRLQGDTATPDNPSNATNWNPSWGWTAGELISNMDDLLVYDRALGTGQGLLDPAEPRPSV